jgi:hypothetical protein
MLYEDNTEKLSPHVRFRQNSMNLSHVAEQVSVSIIKCYWPESPAPEIWQIVTTLVGNEHFVRRLSIE